MSKNRFTYTVTVDCEDVAVENDFAGVLGHILKFCEDLSTRPTSIEISRELVVDEEEAAQGADKIEVQMSFLLESLKKTLRPEEFKKVCRDLGITLPTDEKETQ